MANLKNVPNASSVVNISIDKELKASFLDYAMSVIVSRALPDVRDGLKPVHRRILFAMHKLGLHKERPYRKSATVVGEVIGKYHPHGDSAIYQSMVGLAQEFNKRYTILDGQGNWGSIDGDNAAAMRYTEVRMQRIAREILSDIDKEAVSFTPNYDESCEEPTVLPSKIPQILINGSNGIAVGMATSIPPHNLKEVMQACISILENPELTDRELFDILPAPDFPGGGVICGLSGVMKAYRTGHGSLKLRGVAELEEVGNRECIIISEIPYQVNKAELIKKIAELAKDKVLEGIFNIRDESSRKGIRVVIELKKGAEGKVLINQLFKNTQLESSVSMLLLAILDNRPVVFTLRGIIEQFLLHRKQVITKRTEFDLKKARAREHILLGLIVAIDNIDEAVEIIKKSSDNDDASLNLQRKFDLSIIQTKAILEMRLSRITSMEKDKVRQEIEQLKLEISFLKSIIEDPSVLKQEMLKEATFIRDTYGDERRTRIDMSEDIISDIDLIPNDSMVVMLTQKGYIKRVRMENYAVQHRGGKGKKGISDLGEHDDLIQDVVAGKNHDTLLFFTSKGRVYSQRVFELPEGSRLSRGRAIVNILPLTENERIIRILGTNDLENKFLVMVTRNGVIKKTDSSCFEKIRSTGIIAIDLREEDELAFCGLSSGNDHILLSTSGGYGIRFKEDEVRAMGRQAAGVRGITLRNKAKVVGLEVLPEGVDSHILFATSKGFGKQVLISDFRVAHRGGMGVRTIPVDSRNGQAIGMVRVNENSRILLVDEAGKIIVLNPEEIRTMHRGAKGVRLIRLDENKFLTNIVAFDVSEEEEAAEDGVIEASSDNSEKVSLELKTSTIEPLSDEDFLDDVDLEVEEDVADEESSESDDE